jgi:hypothetical protein
LEHRETYYQVCFDPCFRFSRRTPDAEMHGVLVFLVEALLALETHDDLGRAVIVAVNPRDIAFPTAV